MVRKLPILTVAITLLMVGGVSFLIAKRPGVKSATDSTESSTAPLNSPSLPRSQSLIGPALALPHIPVRGLSLFEPYAGGCEWQYYDIAKARRDLIARLPADCAGIHVSWHPLGKEALVWIINETDGLMLWQVDLSRKKFKRVGPPPTDTIERFAYALSGQPLAFSLSQDQEERLQVWRPKEPAGTEWELAETALVTTDTPDFMLLPSFAALSNPNGLAPWQSSRLDPQPLALPATGSVLAALNKRLPSRIAKTDGEWRSMHLGHWQLTLQQWYMRSDSPEPTGLFFFGKGRTLTRPLLPYQARDFVDPRPLGNWLLLTDHRSGMRPHLFDMISGKLLFASNVAHETTFWPPVPTPSE